MLLGKAEAERTWVREQVNSGRMHCGKAMLPVNVKGLLKKLRTNYLQEICHIVHFVLESMFTS